MGRQAFNTWATRRPLIRRLALALLKHGQHSHICPVTRYHAGDDGTTATDPCRCGFSRACEEAQAALQAFPERLCAACKKPLAAQSVVGSDLQLRHPKCDP